MRVAGIGCRKGVGAREVVAAVEAALARHSSAAEGQAETVTGSGAGKVQFSGRSYPEHSSTPYIEGERVAEKTNPALLDALATAAFKAGEEGIIAAARVLGLRLVLISENDLKRVSGRCLTRSAASLATTGIASVAEAAALAAAGEGSRLSGPRIVEGNVTCAIAQGKDEA